MALTVRGIRYFVAVFEEGTISRAAEREHIVQPALSLQIKTLEEELGVALFERSAQGMQPTQAGHHFYKLSLNILKDIDSAAREMQGFGGNVAGSIRVGLMSSICRGPLAYVLENYVQQYPLVNITLLEANSAALVEKVEKGELDFAICNRPANQTALAIRLLHRDALVLVTGARKGIQPFSVYSPDRHHDLKLVLPSSVNGTRRLIDAHIKNSTIVPSRVIEIDGLGATMQFVARSDWSTILPSIALVGDLHSPDLTISLLRGEDLTSDICEMHIPKRSLSMAGEKMIDTIQSSLKQAEKRMQAKIPV